MKASELLALALKLRAARAVWLAEISQAGATRLTATQRPEQQANMLTPSADELLDPRAEMQAQRMTAAAIQRAKK